MAAKAIRRRIRDVGVDEGRDEDEETSVSDTLNEPLLEKHNQYDGYSELKYRTRKQDITDGRKGKCQCWTYFLSQSISHWAHWIANVVFGFRALVRRFFHQPTTGHQIKGEKRISIILNPLQEERLGNLRQRLDVPFNSSSVNHQDALRELWKLAYPNRELPSLKSELWKEMGWQGSDPSTDFRAGGFMSLENLIYLAKNYPNSFWRLLHKQDGRRAAWEYPFAVAGVNITHMLIQMLDLQSGNRTSRSGSYFLKLLEEDEMAFDMLYCVAFQILDIQWLEKRATYMEFNEILKSTRVQLEQELSLEGISSIKDLPSYKLLSV
ncbi:ELMO domain-containing protein A-like [Zingiber officinale]|uniref:ELMO domain-containing protein A-like n=1 Tax=Zingiber officinale TaxID=94328 RepID=UPI001C4A97F8|nr:ELMO domain-containing protein A-like [Zingiber officinale]XP_042469827.1 ELMO domain-containing protein A-like [Zingiber officinale]XP_042469828.1 ELMO domain-containing protein A-like [Zingiber officinale]